MNQSRNDLIKRYFTDIMFNILVNDIFWSFSIDEQKKISINNFMNDDFIKLLEIVDEW